MTHPPVARLLWLGGDATSGDAYGGDVAQSQEASNTNSTSQDATAESKAVQVLPVNVAVPICVAKACDTGSVEQSNTNTSGDASAKNVNVTDQSNEQWQQGVGGDATTGDATTGGSGDATPGDAPAGTSAVQSASNTNDTWQDASATSKAIQVVPVNVAVPVCIAASCKTGDVEQSNENRSGDASAFNGNSTWQSNEQGQSGYGGDASTGDATTGGKGCCSSGDATSGNAYGGDVDQSQSASNSNTTSQNAYAKSKAVQIAPVNVAVPVCIAWHCETGGVEQSNTNSAGDAWAGNLNHTGQSNEQWQKGVGGDATTGDATTGGECKPTPPTRPSTAEAALRLGRCDERERVRRGRRSVPVGVQLEQHVAGGDCRVEGRAGAARERGGAGLPRPLLQVGRRRPVERQQLG